MGHTLATSKKMFLVTKINGPDIKQSDGDVNSCSSFESLCGFNIRLLTSIKPLDSIAIYYVEIDRIALLLNQDFC